MKRIFLCLLISGFCLTAPCQSTVPEALANSGNHFIAPNAQVSWTIGEAVIETQSAGGNVVTQGFHQTQLTVVGLAQAGPEYEIQVFPNPTSAYIQAEWADANALLDFRLVNMMGQLVLEKGALQGGKASFDLGAITQGEYILQVLHPETNTGKNFRIKIIR